MKIYFTKTVDYIMIGKDWFHFKLFHDEGPYHVETSTFICRANQMDWFLYYMDLCHKRVNKKLLFSSLDHQIVSTDRIISGLGEGNLLFCCCACPTDPNFWQIKTIILILHINQYFLFIFLLIWSFSFRLQ